MPNPPLRLLLALTLSLLPPLAACGGDDEGEGATIDAGDTGGDESTDGDDADDSDDGDDVTASCAETCAGCCDGETCLSGSSADACGLGGGVCTACGPDFLCGGDGVCAIDGASRWDVLAVRGAVFEDNIEGSSWDPFGGLPDPFLNMRSEDAPDIFLADSVTIEDTLAPTWDQVILEDVPARALTGFGLRVEALDGDLAGSDTMGTCTFVAGPDAFGEGEVVSECARDDGSDPPGRGWTLTWRLRRN